MNPECPHCKNETELSAIVGFFICVNHSCQYYRDRVLFDKEQYEIAS